MPRADDHPLRLARLRRSVSVTDLSTATGINRTTLDAIEEGRTKHPTPPTLAAIENHLKLAPGYMQKMITMWFEDNTTLQHRLSLKAKAVLTLSPAMVAQYRSFEHWRRDVAGSPTAFASLVGVPRETVSAYEKGVRVNGMPQTLSAAILRTFDVSDPYLLALQKLEPREERP